MKEKQGNKPNSYGKLMKRMLIYLGIGGVCGFFVGIFIKNNGSPVEAFHIDYL